VLRGGPDGAASGQGRGTTKGTDRAAPRQGRGAARAGGGDGATLGQGPRAGKEKWEGEVERERGKLTLGSKIRR
jgi:hypothetical protein